MKLVQPPKEHPFDVLMRTQSFEEFSKAVVASGGMVSGGRVVDFTGGWARPFDVGFRVTHYWRPHFDRSLPDITSVGRVKWWRSLCGFDSASHDVHAPIFGPGNWSRCKKCQRLHNKGWK